jgi:hypothetical protein
MRSISRICPVFDDISKNDLRGEPVYYPINLFTSKSFKMSQSKDLFHINHSISLNEAVKMTSRFRAQLQSMLQPEYSGSLPIAETFQKSIFIELAAQEGCEAIRSYYGMDDNSRVCIIFVGVDENNNDLLVGANQKAASIFEYGQRCPPICGGVSPLNPPE